MGGGDLNTKKSWHPSTLKNQERVWKAEQAAAEEKKRILELQRERALESDRTQLNEMAQRNFGTGGSNQVGDNRLHWMYDKPDKQVQHEDYLLGKEIGKSDESDRPQNTIPAVSRRVVGSSMTKTLDDTQVDLVRKLREDPLLLVKERERAARAALLNNPLQRKRLAELLRKEKEQKESKGECKTKKKSKKKDQNLDDMLAAKLNALGGKKGIDLSSLLNSNESSSESSSDEKSKKMKKKKKEESKKRSKKNKKKKNASDSEAESSTNENDSKKRGVSPDYRANDAPKYQSYHNRASESTKYDSQNNTRNREANDDNYRKKYERSYDNSKHQSSTNRSDKHKSLESRKRRSDSYNESDGKTEQKKSKREYSVKSTNESDAKHKQRNSPDERDRRARNFTSGKKLEGREKRPGMSEEERAAKLAEMAASGREREEERGGRVARQRAADAAAAADASRRPARSMHEACALPDSLESRIRSNRHYIQRDKMHMNQNFARR